jgi:hypothetical protein
MRHHSSAICLALESSPVHSHVRCWQETGLAHHVASRHNSSFILLFCQQSTYRLWSFACHVRSFNFRRACLQALLSSTWYAIPQNLFFFNDKMNFLTSPVSCKTCTYIHMPSLHLCTAQPLPAEPGTHEASSRPSTPLNHSEYHCSQLPQRGACLSLYSTVTANLISYAVSQEPAQALNLVKHVLEIAHAVRVPEPHRRSGHVRGCLLNSVRVVSHSSMLVRTQRTCSKDTCSIHMRILHAHTRDTRTNAFELVRRTSTLLASKHHHVYLCVCLYVWYGMAWCGIYQSMYRLLRLKILRAHKTDRDSHTDILNTHTHIHTCPRIVQARYLDPSAPCRHLKGTRRAVFCMSNGSKR